MLRCQNCGNSFMREFSRGREPKFCNERCRQMYWRKEARRRYYRDKGFTEEQIKGLMQGWTPMTRHQRAMADMPPDELEILDRKHQHRRCRYEIVGIEGEGSLHCITLLCRYNPGPYCYLHAQMVADAAFIDMQNKMFARLRHAA